MTDTLIALLLQYGAVLVGLATGLSCIALPIPASLVMLSAGAFTATGDLSLVPTALAALVGALIGDQAGFAIGRQGAGWLDALATRRAHLAEALTAARNLSNRYGAPGIFLSRWLVSPLGPYVNFTTGATGTPWARFTLWAAAGEVVWVALYIGLGAAFGSQVQAIADILGNLSGTLAAGLVTALIGLWAFRGPHSPLFRRRQTRRQERRQGRRQGQPHDHAA